MPRPRPPVDAEGYSRAVFHKRANYDGWARPEVVDPTGRQHPHKYVVRFAYYKDDGAEPGWHVGWNDNTECWMDDHEVEDDVEAMRVFAERAVDGAMAAQAARQAKYAEEALLRARLAKRLKNKEAAQAKTAAELEAEKQRRKAEEEAARSGIPILYDEDDLQELSSSAAAPIDGEKFAQQKSALLEKVEITNHGVVHGYGVKARVPLSQGTVLLDPTALMHSGDPLHVVGGKEFSEAYISTGNGSYFRIHWFSGDTIFRSAATFWINEARDCEPNVEYKSTYDGRMLSALVMTALPEVDDDGRLVSPEERRTSPRTSPRSSPRPKTSSPPRTCFGMERPPATVEDVSASKRPCLNPASKRPYERPSLTEVNSADPEDDAELICRPKKSPAKRQRVTP